MAKNSPLAQKVNASPSKQNRKSISKSLRFKIFARDGFTCRYCGKDSSEQTLEIDHILPVCQGGGNDEENLITSCFDCNRGKAGKTIEQTVPDELSRLAREQSLREQEQALETARETAQAREAFRDEIACYWCEVTGRDEYNVRTLNTVTSYARTFGAEVVFDWIDRAATATGGSDRDMGRYISGIRRCYLNEKGGE